MAENNNNTTQYLPFEDGIADFDNRIAEGYCHVAPIRDITDSSGTRLGAGAHRPLRLRFAGDRRRHRGLGIRGTLRAGRGARLGHNGVRRLAGPARAGHANEIEPRLERC